MKKYLVVSGYIQSKYDNEIHFVSCKELCRLYGVNKEDCIYFSENEESYQEKLFSKDLIVLRPRYDGDYKL